MRKIKHCFLVLLLLAGFLPSVFSQVVPKTTPAVPDTTIVETLTETNQDNIPVISLDEADGQDGSAQNISS